MNANEHGFVLAKFQPPKGKRILECENGEFILHCDHIQITKRLEENNLELARQVSALQLSHDSIINSLGIKGDGPVSKLVIEYVMGLVAENVALKKDLIFWDNDDPERPFDHPVEIASECEMPFGTEFTVQVAARMPKRTYRVTRAEEYEYEVEMVEGAEIETPATDAAIAKIGLNALKEFAASVGAEAEGLSPSSKEYKSIKSTVFRAVKFAANLRAGRKG